jgi:hypothetical protein
MMPSVQLRLVFCLLASSLAAKPISAYAQGGRPRGSDLDLIKPHPLSQLRERPNNDKVEMSFFRARKHNPALVDRTYQRGLRELLDRQFLYRSPSEGVFFVNIQYMFNGDRLAFVKAYHLKGAKPQNEQLSFLPPD